jgi:hypothetical protein
MAAVARAVDSLDFGRRTRRRIPVQWCAWRTASIVDGSSRPASPSFLLELLATDLLQRGGAPPSLAARPAAGVEVPASSSRWRGSRGREVCVVTVSGGLELALPSLRAHQATGGLSSTAGRAPAGDGDPGLGGRCGDGGLNLDIFAGLELALPLHMVGSGPPGRVDGSPPARAPSFPSRGGPAPSRTPPPSPAAPWWLVGRGSRREARAHPGMKESVTPLDLASAGVDG